ncbi:AbrB/MazE/SpoVT family DNA-binding domain-containing protein [Rhodanobacter geophilus]|uniref:AbrB/MazE/SpoVT family DNA-binding domain-containing protein n=1 Tax=Rhodanobacter geophilus TaxID=3162488 RepID=A0ABV3QM85_9GAMM
MLAKLTSKNQLTLPKAAVEATGNAEYFEVEARAGQLVLTPVRIQRADAVRARLAALKLGDDDLAAAVAWARLAARVAEPRGRHESKPSSTGKPAPRRKP